MKSTIVGIVLAALTVPPSCFSQVKVGLYFETAPYGSNTFLSDTRVRNALRIFPRPATITLVQAVCIPSFEPSWVVRIYHPPASRFKVEAGDTTEYYAPDTLTYAIESVTTKIPLGLVSSRPDNWSGWGKASLYAGRSIPDTVARIVESAFVRALLLSRWAKDADLLRIDGTEYHFAAYDIHARTHFAAQSNAGRCLLSSGLEELSRALYDYSRTKNDSTSTQMQLQIYKLSAATQSRCDTLAVHSHTD